MASLLQPREPAPVLDDFFEAPTLPVDLDTSLSDDMAKVVAAGHLGNLSLAKVRKILREKNSFTTAVGGDGLDLPKFTALMQSVAAASDSSSCLNNPAFVLKLFHKFDANQDGEVSFDEMQLLLASMASDDLDVKLHFMFDCLDADSSYYLEENEVVRFVKCACTDSAVLMDTVLESMPALGIHPANRELLRTASGGCLEVHMAAACGLGPSGRELPAHLEGLYQPKPPKRAKKEAEVPIASAARRLVGCNELARATFRLMDTDGDGRVSFPALYYY